MTNDERILQWFIDGVFHINEDDKICKGDRVLSERKNPRNRSERGDPRVTLCHESKKFHRTVSRLIWSVKMGLVIPDNFEIHHLNEDPEDNRFENLVLVHAVDHAKIHRQSIADVPF